MKAPFSHLLMRGKRDWFIFFVNLKKQWTLSGSNMIIVYEMQSANKVTAYFVSLVMIVASGVLSSCVSVQPESWQDDVRIGRLAMHNGEEEKAKLFLSKGIEGARYANVDPIVIAPIYLDLSRTETALKNPDGARSAVDAARVAASSGGKDNEQLIPIYKESAKLFYRKKDFVNSQLAAQNALRLERECCDAKSEKLLDSLNLCISAACAQDRCADTGPLLEEQLEIRKEHLGPVHPHVAVSLCLLGELAEKKGQWKEAEARYIEALSIRKKTEPGLVKQTEKNLVRVRTHLEKKTG
jgi:tetratricopeptide (TPR) repeat protein